ncbi:MAG: adenylate kinase family protein, partial [Infirmifilum sp.]
GVGKTTVAHQLASKLGLKYLNLGDIVKDKGLYTQYDARTDSYIVDLKKTRRYLEQILTCKEILDTHLVEAVPPKKISKAIVLRLDPLVLRDRLKKRGYVYEKIEENLEAEILDYVLIKAMKRIQKDSIYEVDTTGKTIGEIVEIITKIIQENSKEYRPGSVDWLTKYYFLIEKKGGII